MNILISVIISVFLVLILFQQQLILNTLRTLQIADEPDAVPADIPSEYEQMRIKRESSFDERINRLKDEIALSHVTERKGTPAEELHPLVKNLPHGDIHIKYDLPDEEYAK